MPYRHTLDCATMPARHPRGDASHPGYTDGVAVVYRGAQRAAEGCGGVRRCAEGCGEVRGGVQLCAAAASQCADARNMMLGFPKGCGEAWERSCALAGCAQGCGISEGPAGASRVLLTSVGMVRNAYTTCSERAGAARHHTTAAMVFATCAYCAGGKTGHCGDAIDPRNHVRSGYSCYAALCCDVSMRDDVMLAQKDGARRSNNLIMRGPVWWYVKVYAYAPLCTAKHALHSHKCAVAHHKCHAYLRAMWTKPSVCMVRSAYCYMQCFTFTYMPACLAQASPPPPSPPTHPPTHPRHIHAPQHTQPCIAASPHHITHRIASPNTTC